MHGQQIQNSKSNFKNNFRTFSNFFLLILIDLIFVAFMFVWNQYRNALHLMDFYVLVIIGNVCGTRSRSLGATPFCPEPEPERSHP